MGALLALAVGLQEETAREAFQKIERAIRDARTHQVKFKSEATVDSGGRQNNFAYTGVLLLKEGHRVHLDTRLGDFETTVVSDGAKESHSMVNFDKTRTTFHQELDRTRHSYLLETLCEGGLFPANLAKRFAPEDRQKTGRVFELSRFRKGEAKEGACSIVCDIRIAGREEPGELTIWYEPKTHRLLKRSLIVEMGILGFSAKCIETYEEFVLGGEIPDGKFKLPEQKFNAPPDK